MFDWIEKGSVAIVVFLGIVQVVKKIKDFFNKSSIDKITALSKEVNALQEKTKCHETKIQLLEKQIQESNVREKVIHHEVKLEELEKKIQETNVEVAKILTKIDYIVESLKRIEDYVKRG